MQNKIAPYREIMNPLKTWKNYVILERYKPIEVACMKIVKLSRENFTLEQATKFRRGSRGISLFPH